MISGDKNVRLDTANAIVNDLQKAMEMGFSSLDFAQIQEHGISLQNIHNQLYFFKNGISKTVLVEPATVSNGILKLSENDFQQKADFFDANKSNLLKSR